MRCAALGLSLALCIAAQDHLEAEAQDSNERELKSCMARIEYVEPMLTLEADVIECFKTATGRNPGAQFFDVQSRPEPRRLPDGRRYIIIGGVNAHRDLYAELKDYPDETALRHVGQELRRLACEKGSDAILKAGLSCGLCPDREYPVPCVFAHGYFIVWVGTQQEK